MNVDASRVVEILVTAGVTLFVSIVTFRTRLYAMSRDIREVKENAARDLAENIGRTNTRLETVEAAVSKYGPTLRLIDRRTLFILQILAEQAKASGMDRRVPDDLLVRMLADNES